MSARPAMRPILCAAAVCVLLAAPLAFAKLPVESGCSDAKDHCDAPKSGMGCCVGNSKCYNNTDCASYLKTCPFGNDTKTGDSLNPCLPDKSDFRKAACPVDAAGKAKSTDGKAIPLKSKVTCFQSEKLTCQIFRNESGHTFVSTQCKQGAKKASAAAAVTWRAYLLVALLLVAGAAAVLGPSFS